MKVIIIDDDASIRRTTAIAIRDMGHRCDVVRDGDTALKKMGQDSYDVALLDLKLREMDGLELLPKLLEAEPGLHIVVFTAFASIESAVKAIKKGAFDYVPKPFTPDQIQQVFEKIEQVKRLESRVTALESDLDNQSPIPSFETNEPKVRRIFELAKKAAAAGPATVFLLGESGTGKTVLARWIHEQSARKEHPFVTVHCPSMSRELLESELFGHARGAFTGAVQDKKGKVAVADKGTLFLDEIGEMPLDLQAKLLRLLQEKEYERIGDNRTRHADVRIIAATNRSPSKMVEEKHFREDLYYRLNVMPITVPPLRERPQDIRELAEKYTAFYAPSFGKSVYGISEGAFEAMRQYRWPGNLRELENAIERAVILTNGHQIGVEDLPDTLGTETANKENAQSGQMITLEALEREHIARVIQRTESLEQAARVLGIDSATLYRKRKRFNLNYSNHVG